MNIKNFTRTSLVAALLSCAVAVAEERDVTGIAGATFEAGTSTVVYGAGGATPTRVWIPWLLPSGSSAMNGTATSIVDGDIRGTITTFSSIGNPRLVALLGTADRRDANGNYTSNNVVINEGAINRSNTFGQLLADGTAVYRANFAGVPQNNIEWVRSDLFSQLPAAAEPNVPTMPLGEGILSGPGTSGFAGTVQLGTPAAMAETVVAGVVQSLWLGVTTFDSFTGNVPRGTCIWLYSKGTPLPAATPTYTYLQTAAETWATAQGVPVAAGNGRQTQPVLASVNGTDYVVFGVNDTTLGGSARPAIMCVDAFQDNDAFTGAIPVIPPTGWIFVDHQATGGGSGPFENKHFDMNSDGQLVVLAERSGTVATYAIWLYNPIIDTMSGRITGFNSPITIADGGPFGVVADNISDPIADPNNIADPFINPLSGVGINDNGNIAFTGIYDPNDLTAVYFYDGASATLHQVLLEDETIAFGLNSQDIGLLPQEGSDSFFATSLADNADVIAVPFRARGGSTGDARGVAVIAVNHIGDVNFSNGVDAQDLAFLLASFGSSFGTPSYDPEADFDLDGDVDAQDLAFLLANFGS